MTFKQHLKTELFSWRDWKENTAGAFCDIVNIKERFEMSE